MLGMKLVDLHQSEIDGVSSKISWVRHPIVDNRIIVPCLLQTARKSLKKSRLLFIGNNVSEEANSN